MTIVNIVRNKDKKIAKIKCHGHTGYGAEGEDIVCAALSSVVQTAILGLLQVAVINVDYKILDEEGSLELTLPEDLTDLERNNADMILETMLCGIMDLNESFSRYIKLEVK